MALEREILELQMQAETAWHTRMTLWSKIQGLYQDEMITKLGFAIEAAGMFEEELAQLRRENTAGGQKLIANLETLLDAGE